MNASTSAYSGACESGWTMYLDQFSSPVDDDDDDDQYNRRSANVDLVDSRRKQAYEYEDEDMLSDASSGPPNNYQQQENYSEESFRYGSRISVSGQKQGKNRKGVRGENVQLDDTASSPVQTYSKNNALAKKDKFMVEQGSGFSQATQYKGKSVLKKHFGFLKSSHQKS